MANIKISELPAAASVATTDVLVVNQGVNTRKATVSQALAGVLTTSQIAGLATTAPAALATAPVVGLSTYAARADHQHVLPSAGQIGALTTADIAGLATTAPAALATAPVVGLSQFAARADHQHVIPNIEGTYFEFFEHFMSTAGVTGNLSFGVTSGAVNTNVTAGYGSVQMSTGVTATAGAQSRLTQGQAILIGNSACRLIFRISQATATWFDATLTGAVRFGLASSATSESSSAIYFRATDSQAIQFCTRNSNIETATNTGISFSNGVFNTFEISFDATGTSVTAKIDGNVVATHTTNIPVGTMGILAQITRASATGTAVAMNVDYIYNRVTPATPYF